MSQFIGTSMPVGFAGSITRGFFDHTVEVIKNDATTPVVGFGVPIKLNSTADAVAACSATSDKVVGFAVREYGQANCEGEQDQNFVSVLKRGYMVVKLESGTAAKGGTVYLTSTGTISAAANDGEDEPTSYTAIPDCFFMGPAVGGLVEIAYNI